MLSFLFRRSGNGGHLWDFHKHLQGFLPGGGESPTYFGEWEMCDLTATLASFVFLELPSSFQLMDLSTCYSHSWELCSHSSWNSCHTLASVSQLKEYLRKVCLGYPAWHDISQMPLHSHEAVRLVLPHGLRANVIVGTLELKLY